MICSPMTVCCFMNSHSSSVERPRLGDDLIGNAELADVVQVAGLDDQIDRVLVEPDRAREQLDVAGDVV